MLLGVMGIEFDLKVQGLIVLEFLGRQFQIGTEKIRSAHFGFIGFRVFLFHPECIEFFTLGRTEIVFTIPACTELCQGGIRMEFRGQMQGRWFLLFILAAFRVTTWFFLLRLFSLILLITRRSQVQILLLYHHARKHRHNDFLHGGLIYYCPGQPICPCPSRTAQ